MTVMEQLAKLEKEFPAPQAKVLMDVIELQMVEGVATKEDLQRVKVEMIQWMAGLAITIILFVVGFGLTVLSRLPAPPTA